MLTAEVSVRPARWRGGAHTSPPFSGSAGGADQSSHAVGIPFRLQGGVRRSVGAGAGDAECRGADHPGAGDAGRHEDQGQCGRQHVPVAGTPEVHLELAREQVRLMEEQAAAEEQRAKRQVAARRRAARQRRSRLEAAVREVERLQREKKDDCESFVARASSTDPEAHVMRNGAAPTRPKLNPQGCRRTLRRADPATWRSTTKVSITANWRLPSIAACANAGTPPRADRCRWRLHQSRLGGGGGELRGGSP